MKLIANTCVECNRVIGYITDGAYQIPTLCILCASDNEVMKEWGHRIAPKEKLLRDVLLSYRSELYHHPLLK